MRVAYQGLPGAFSHEACLAFLPDHEPVAEPSFEAVVEAVVEKRADRGVLPLENVAAGPVPGVRALMDEAFVRVVGEHAMPVRMHLLGLPGARVERLTSVVSHPMALKQCRRAVERLGLATRHSSNTAVAAAGLKDPTEAVLASEAAAKAYGLKILLPNVHDDPENATLFAILGGREC